MILIDMTNLYCGYVKCKVYELKCDHAFESLFNTQGLISEAKLWTVAALGKGFKAQPNIILLTILMTSLTEMMALDDGRMSKRIFTLHPYVG